MRPFSLLLVPVLLASLLLTPAVQASGAAGTVTYINLMPPLVGNYDPGGKKLKYFKADIALRVSNDNKAKAEAHELLIRDQLVMLFSQKTEDELSTIEGKEALRQEALQRVQQALMVEEGHPLVEDLLFNNLIVQK